MKLAILLAAVLAAAPDPQTGFEVREDDRRIQIVGRSIEAAIAKKGYVTGVEAQSFLDRKTGFRDLGFGLDIVDWIMEPGSDEAYRDRLPGDLAYVFNNRYHGKRPKRSIEGPQICTQARELSPRVIRGKDFVGDRARLHLQARRPGQEDRLAVGADDRLPRRQAVLPLLRPDHRASTAATRCSCGSTCPATSSTRTATRSARST